jgi:peptidoglycan/xylan/chitin deacetylase (PgdA/CDA1 family)
MGMIVRLRAMIFSFQLQRVWMRPIGKYWCHIGRCRIIMNTKTDSSNMIRRIALSLFIVIVCLVLQSHITEPAKRHWHGKKAAVVLTYDDALEVHLDHAIPALDSLGLKATFYLSADFPGCKNRIQDWRRAARNGHELGNHTLFHPCDGSKPGRSFVSPQNDLSRYTTDRIVREVEMSNVFLEALDGKKERTFAYTCGDTETAEGSFIEAIKGQFVSLRGVRSRINKLETLDLTNVDCFAADTSNEDQLVAWAKKAKEEQGLLVILFHGVGGGHALNVNLEKHNRFLKYLKDHKDDYWITTMLEASKYCLQELKK